MELSFHKIGWSLVVHTTKPKFDDNNYWNSLATFDTNDIIYKKVFKKKIVKENGNVYWKFQEYYILNTESSN
jgi:hypothetical protein